MTRCPLDIPPMAFVDVGLVFCAGKALFHEGQWRCPGLRCAVTARHNHADAQDRKRRAQAGCVCLAIEWHVLFPVLHCEI